MAARKQRRYSDDEKANALAALDANGGDVSKTARQLKLPRMTLEDWSNGRVHPVVTEARQEKKETLADAIEGVAWKLVGAIPGKIADASLKDVAVALGIAVEKTRLLREQATSINSSTTLTDDERIQRLKQLAERIRERRAEPAHANGTSGV